jgi:hypothetical protein
MRLIHKLSIFCHVFRTITTGNSKYDKLRKWTYAELRDTINTSCGKLTHNIHPT